jgi:predicted lipid-binding transport protein (Tim44 family)
MEILFFAAIAVFILFKLREQLGKVDEDQKRSSIKKFLKEQTKITGQNQKSTQDNNPILMNPDNKKDITANLNTDNFQPVDEKSQKIIDGLDGALKSDLELVLKTTNLSANVFLTGAKNAFEIIISTFSIGNLEILQPLLSEKIFLQFQTAINERNTKGEILHTKIISINEANITSATLEGQFGYITILFSTKQINYVENNKKEIILGSKIDINIVADSWTFKKDCKSRNPNWLLSSTSQPN